MTVFNPSQIRGLIIDMDGVLWRGPEPIGDLAKLFRKLDELRLNVILASNNATASVAMFQQKLASFGVQIASSQIITSSIVSANYLKELFPDGGPVYVVGERGLIETLQEYGFEAIDEGEPLAVIAGLDREITYHKLSFATRLVRNGAIFIGTNPDATYPTPDGLVPGAGAIIAAIETATSTRATLMGKPEPEIFRVCLERLNLVPGQVLVVGDRLETDIAGGQRLNMPVALVLSGVTSFDQAKRWQPEIAWIGPDLSTLIFDTLAG